MGVFLEDGERYVYGLDMYVRQLTPIGRVAAVLGTIGCCAALGVGLFSSKGLDIIGENDSPLPKAGAIEKNIQKYQKTFKEAGPAAKFVMQYLSTVNISSDAYKKDGHGIKAWAFISENDQYVSTFNNACLQNTAFDTAGGSVDGSYSGVFVSGSVEGRVPTAIAYAEIDGNNDDHLIVHAGNVSSHTLQFSGLKEGPALQPVDDFTKRILATNECKVGLQKTEHY